MLIVKLTTKHFSSVLSFFLSQSENIFLIHIKILVFFLFFALVFFSYFFGFTNAVFITIYQIPRQLKALAEYSAFYYTIAAKYTHYLELYLILGQPTNNTYFGSYRSIRYSYTIIIIILLSFIHYYFYLLLFSIVK